MQRHAVFVFVLLGILATPALATSVPADIAIGLLSFDIFIPAGSGTGVNAFNIYNLTGPVYGPAAGDPYASDSLTLASATLTANILGGGDQVFTLGDLAPGELLDGTGNPVIQFPSTIEFTSATLTATLTPGSFMLSDGTTFTAVTSISVDLTPSSGDVLVAGTDFAPIYAEAQVTSGTPEPDSRLLLAGGLLVMLGLAAKKARRQFMG